MFIKRKLAEIIDKTSKSLLLLGPRQTGKSTFCQSLNPKLTINLANEQDFLEHASDPGALGALIKANQAKSVFVDEIQRLPSMLNTIQAIIDDSKKSIRFFLTGSSARKLRRGKANLLPGRVLAFEMGPFIYSEIPELFSTNIGLSLGTLPGILTEENSFDREQLLRSYAGTYLKEEIQAEALTRDLQGFARFLRIVAATAGQFLDISKLSNEAMIKRPSGIRFFEILEDTLLMLRCDSFAKSERKRLIQHPRYFFFDNGVLNGVLGNFKVSPDRVGALFEHFVFTQIYHTSKLSTETVRISHYRTEHGAEVDFIVEKNDLLWAIECKASLNVGKNDLSGLNNFAEYYKKPHQKMVIYLGTAPKKLEDVHVVPLPDALRMLFS